MISSISIEEYLSRDLENWNWIKDINKETLIKELKKVFPSYAYKTFEPYKHQIEMLLIGIINPNFLFFSTMGTGKTRISLDILQYYKSKKLIKKALIICYNVSSIDTWVDEIELHTDFTYTPLYGTTLERKDMLKEVSTDITILNYTGLQRICTVNHKNKWIIIDNKINKYFSNFDFVIFDESHLFKSKDSLTYKICNKITNKIPIRYALTGTPMGRNPKDLWSQFQVIDKGETLGNNINLFMEAFYKEEKNLYFPGYTYNFDKTKKKVLNKLVSNKSIRYEDDEVNELPKLIHITKKVNFPTDNYNYYEELKSKIISLKNLNFTDKENNFIKLRQICSGFVNFKNEFDEKSTIIFMDNPKMDALEELIESIDSEAKIIISNEFILSGNLICEMLKKRKEKFSRLYGGTKDKVGSKNEFKKGNSRILVLNSQSGGVSENFQISHYLICYELPTSPIIYNQLIKRVHRTGQTEKTRIYKLIVKNSIEEKILRYLKEGKDLFEAIIKGEEDLI
jgi:SNF2 family DNA or RNA helicase